MSSPRSRSSRASHAVRAAVAALVALATVAPGVRAQPRRATGGAVVARDDDVVPTVVVVPFEFAAPRPESRGWRRSPPPRPPILTPGLAIPVLHGAPPMPPRAGRTRAGPPPCAEPSDDEIADVGSQLGAGVSDLLVERLVAAGGFRVLDRRWLGARSSPDSLAHGGGGARPRYTIAGSVTRFDVEESGALALLGRLAGLGGFGLRRPRATVTLVARIVDARTGEVVATAQGDGVSRRGAGLTLGGIARGGGGIVSVGSKAFRESALGEATDRAVAGLARRIVEQRAGLTERD